MSSTEYSEDIYERLANVLDSLPKGFPGPNPEWK